MARTGFCDSRALLDRKIDEVRFPLRTWANACTVRERAVLSEGEEQEQEQQQKADNTHTKWKQSHLSSVRALLAALLSQFKLLTPDSTTTRPPRPETVGNRSEEGNTVFCLMQVQLLFAEDGIIMEYDQQRRSVVPAVEHYEEEAVLNHLHGLQLAPTLGDPLPELVSREIEVAMSKLGLLYDHTYTWDVFSDMMRSQQHLGLSTSDLPKPFTETTHVILVDWLIQVHEAFNFSEETLYLAVHLLNRVLRQIKISISSLQLLGAVCLFLAAKKEECLLPEVSELCYLMANTYSKKQLLRMERRVLCALNFDLSHTPPIHFLLLSACIARCGEKVIFMARYLLELSLLEAKCVRFFPVQLAAAALRLARHLIQEPSTPESEVSWCIASTIYLGSEATLFTIMHIMAAAAARAHNQQTRATFVKFSTKEMLYVSLHPAVKSAPCLLSLQP